MKRHLTFRDSKLVFRKIFLSHNNLLESSDLWQRNCDNDDQEDENC